MLWQILALAMTTFGVTLLYLSNKNQRFILKPLRKKGRITAYICLFVALIAWLQIFAVSTAIFLWFFTSTIALIAVPLLSLWRDSSIRSAKSTGKTL